MHSDTSSIAEIGPYVLAGVAFLSLVANVMIARRTAERTEQTAYFQADVCVPVYDNLSDLKRELVDLSADLIDKCRDGEFDKAKTLLDARRNRAIGPIINELSKRIGAGVDMYADDRGGAALTFVKRKRSLGRLKSAVSALEEDRVDEFWQALEGLGCQLDEGGRDSIDCTGLIGARIDLDNAARRVVNELRRQFIRRQALLP